MELAVLVPVRVSSWIAPGHAESELETTAQPELLLRRSASYNPDYRIPLMVLVF